MPLFKNGEYSLCRRRNSRRPVSTAYGAAIVIPVGLAITGPLRSSGPCNPFGVPVRKKNICSPAVGTIGSPQELRKPLARIGVGINILAVSQEDFLRGAVNFSHAYTHVVPVVVEHTVNLIGG